MRKILYLLNHWSDEAVYVTDGKLGEFPTFWYSTQGKNPIRKAPEFIFLQRCNLSKIAVFGKPIVLQKALAPKPLIG
jgi:hypothetical protein